MKVSVLSSFERDFKKIKDPNIKIAIVEIIKQLERAETLSQAEGVRKLVGSSDKYRIKTKALGSYRIGLSYYKNEFLLELIRVLPRKDVYRKFK